MRLRPLAAARALGRSLRRRIENHALVLMYHRVATAAADPWRLCVSPQHFAEQMEVLKRRCTVVPLHEIERRLCERRPSRPLVAVSFDDGYADNLHTALPILERLEVPAVVFVATSWTGRARPFWWDLLADCLLGPGRRPVCLRIELGGRTIEWSGGRDADRAAGDSTELQALHGILWDWLRMLPDEERSAALEKLETWAGRTASIDALARPMTAEEVASLHSSGVVRVGAHSRSHRGLPTLSVRERWSEIEGSMQDCLRMLGTRPTDFAYPHGEFDAVTSGLVRRAGFERGFAATQGLMWAGGDRFRIPRIAIRDVGGDLFERQLRTEWLP